MIGCVGVGSNFAGFALPFVHRNLIGESSSRLIAVEPTACPSLTRGRSTYDFADTAELALIVKLHTLGHPFVPPGIRAGGLACRAGARPRPQYARVNRPSFIEDQTPSGRSCGKRTAVIPSSGLAGRGIPC